MRKWMLWAALLVVGCNGKLSVSDSDNGGADSGGADSGGAGAGGKVSHAGSAGKPQEMEAGAPAGGYDGIAGRYSVSGGPGTAGTGVGGTGGVVIPPGPGQNEQDCVLGGLVTEADGSPAKSVIKTLDHCDEGLACNAQGKCVPAPDCPSSGLCVLRRAALAGSGGFGGAPGGYVPGGGAPGSAGSSGGGQTPVVGEETGVVALTANDSHVYWLEYGTRDALGNYQHDGALMSYSIVDGTTTTLAAALEGPMGLELTTSHAYVYVDGAPLIDTEIIPQLLRVPLAGGSPQLVQDGTRPAPIGFAAAGSRAFWTVGTAVYSMLSDANAVPTVFLAEYAATLNTDATDLYYFGSNGDLMRTPLAGAASTAVGVSVGSYALHDDGIFTLETVNGGGLLSRAPKTGGAFLRVRALGAGQPSNLKVVGDRYFVDMLPTNYFQSTRFYSRQVLTAGFVGTDPPVRLLERPDRRSLVDQLWVGTAGALYWSEGQAIYKQPLPTP